MKTAKRGMILVVGEHYIFPLKLPASVTSEFWSSPEGHTFKTNLDNALKGAVESRGHTFYYGAHPRWWDPTYYEVVVTAGTAEASDLVFDALISAANDQLAAAGLSGTASVSTAGAGAGVQSWTPLLIGAGIIAALYFIGRAY